MKSLDSKPSRTHQLRGPRNARGLRRIAAADRRGERTKPKPCRAGS